MKPLKFAIPALILATAGAAGAQSVTTDSDVSADTQATAGESASVGVGVEATSQANAETGSGAAETGQSVAAEASGEADLQLSKGADVVARDGVTIGTVADIVDKAQGLVRVELDDALETGIPAVVLSTETMTEVDGEVQLPLTGEEFTAALAQLAEQSKGATD